MEAKDPETLFNQLKCLSSSPPSIKKSRSDLSRWNLLQVQAPSWEFYYANERVNPEIMTKLEMLAQQKRVFLLMQEMQEGKRVNSLVNCPSEDRAALHTALRSKEDLVSKEAQRVKKEAQKERERIALFLNQRDESHLIVIGIGGSHLGPEALYHALSDPCPKNREVSFLTTLDEGEFKRTCTQYPLKNTLVAVISKSGSTQEVQLNEERLKKEYENQNLKPSDFFVSITTKGSKIDRTSDYSSVFYMDESIGGRYSLTSSVGAFPLIFAYGNDVFHELLSGAFEMDQNALVQDYRENMAFCASLISIWNRIFLSFSSQVIVPYSSAMKHFVDHLQQLEMESNGKGTDRFDHPIQTPSGPLLWGSYGTSAQHSFFQWLHQGTDIAPVQFIGFRNSSVTGNLDSYHQALLSNLLGQSLALSEGQESKYSNQSFGGERPSSILLTDELSPKSLGALLSFYEHKTVFEGFFLGINPFDQEGVELGKKLGKQVLKREDPKLLELLTLLRL